MQPVNINVIAIKVTKNPETPKKCFAVCEKHANAEKINKRKFLVIRKAENVFYHVLH